MSPSSDMKSLAALIGSVAALLAAAASLIQTPKEPAAEAAYSALGDAVKENTVFTQKNHDDILALRNYLDGYLQRPTNAAADSPAAPAASSSPKSASSRPRLPPPVAPPPLPPMHDRPPNAQLPDFTHLRKE